MLRLTAIVPATDDPPTLGRCLEAIRRAAAPPEEILVVDRADGPGPAAARNDGAARASGEVVVFVDADVLPHSDAFTRIRRAFGEQEGLVALFGSYDDTPTAPGAVSGFRNLLHHHVHQSAGGASDSFWAGLGAVRRDRFMACGGFDESRYQRPSIEDIELGGRLVAAGGAVWLDPRLQATHLKAWTLREMIRVDLLDRGVPWLTLLFRRGELPASLNLGWRHRLSAVASIVAVAAVVRRRRGPALAGLGALVCLNVSFYRLLLRRRGPVDAALGVGLHALHHVTAGVAVPLALRAHLRERRTRGRLPAG